MVATGDRPSSNGLKLQRGKRGVETRRTFLAVRAVNHWTGLPEYLWNLHPFQSGVDRPMAGWLGHG